MFLQLEVEHLLGSSVILLFHLFLLRILTTDSGRLIDSFIQDTVMRIFFVVVELVAVSSEKLSKTHLSFHYCYPIVTTRLSIGK